MLKKEILPIGSIVYLKEGTEKLMVLNRGALLKENEEPVIFDYSGAIYPMGLNPDKVFYFNQENIDKIVFEGYSDEEEERFQELYKNWQKENSGIKKGEVREKL